MNGGDVRLRGLGRLTGVAGFALTALLAVFHGGLLWQRLTDGSLLEPAVVVRWAVSALLALALLQLWSRGLPLLRGRRAAVLWLVIILLHSPVAAGSPPAIVPAAAGMLPAVLVLLGIVAVGLAAVPQRGPTAPRRAAIRQRRRTGRASAGWYPILFSRPPPVSLHS